MAHLSEAAEKQFKSQAGEEFFCSSVFAVKVRGAKHAARSGAAALGMRGVMCR